MPHALPKPCRFPRCPALTRERFCAAHKQQVQREYDATRGTTTQRGYGTSWQRLRREHLMRQPACVACGSTQRLNVDHIVPLARGGTNDTSNLQTLCAACHSTKTATRDGGYGRGASV